MTSNEKEIKVANETILATIVFIATLFVSLALSYDKREKLKNNDGLFTKKQSRRISIINRTVVVILALFYFQIDRETIGIEKDKNTVNNLLYLQASIELVAIITALVSLYITIKSSDELINIENPNL